jgi:hypothetical protein
MANVTAVANLRNQVPYMDDGVRQAMDSVMRFLPPDIIAADTATWFAFAAISTTKQSVSTVAGTRPLVVLIKSNGTVSYVMFHNVAAASVTEGVNADMVLPCGGTTGRVASYIIGGNSSKDFWTTGLVVEASSTQETSAAPTNPPDVFVLCG